MKRGFGKRGKVDGKSPISLSSLGPPRESITWHRLLYYSMAVIQSIHCATLTLTLPAHQDLSLAFQPAHRLLQWLMHMSSNENPLQSDVRNLFVRNLSNIYCLNAEQFYSIRLANMLVGKYASLL